MYDVITVGSSTVDVFAYTDKAEAVKIKGVMAEEDFIAYPTGSKVLIRNMMFSLGGGGTNAAATFSRMGLKVGYIGKVGTDDNGKNILKFLKENNIDFLGAIGEGTSGYSFILDSTANERTILVHKGVNNDLKFDEIKKDKLKTKWFYFSSMMKEAFKTMEKIADYAAKNKMKVAFNPSSYLIELGYDYLRNVIEKTTVFIVNKEEAAMLVKPGSIMEMLKKLKGLGPEMVIITDGERGAHFYNGKDYYSVGTHKIKVIETTGVGDAFSSAFVAGLIKKGNVEFALKLAMANAHSVLQHHGAKAGLLKWEEAEKEVKENPVGITKKEI